MLSLAVFRTNHKIDWLLCCLLPSTNPWDLHINCWTGDVEFWCCIRCDEGCLRHWVQQGSKHHYLPAASSMPTIADDRITEGPLNIAPLVTPLCFSTGRSKCSHVWCLPLQVRQLNFDGQTATKCRPINAQFDLPRHCLLLTRAQLLLTITLRDWLWPTAFFHLTTGWVLNSWGVGFLMHLLRRRLGGRNLRLVTTGFQCAASSIHECS